MMVDLTRKIEVKPVGNCSTFAAANLQAVVVVAAVHGSQLSSEATESSQSSL